MQVLVAVEPLLETAVQLPPGPFTHVVEAFTPPFAIHMTQLGERKIPQLAVALWWMSAGAATLA
jgi:hypothetical protein